MSEPTASDSQGPSLVLAGGWLDNLLREIDDADYCYVCGEHPSHGHRAGCPADGIGPVEEGEGAGTASGKGNPRDVCEPAETSGGSVDGAKQVPIRGGSGVTDVTLSPEVIEFCETFAKEHGIAMLMDHLGLDGLGNDVTNLHAVAAAARVLLARVGVSERTENMERWAVPTWTAERLDTALHEVRFVA